jgi:hypothetical protein
MEHKLNFPICIIALDAITMDGGEELYEYLKEQQGIEIDSNKNYLEHKGVGNEFFSDEDDYLYVYLKREDLKDEKAFEQKMDNYFWKNFEISFSHHQM